jgi:hypothetical protein
MNCEHKYECGCDKTYCGDCLIAIENENDGDETLYSDMCDAECCKQYYKYRNDNCNCDGLDCGFCNPQPVRIRRDAKANPTIEDWEGKYGGFKLWNENWKLWNTYESDNDTIMEAMLVGAYFTLNRTLEYLPPNLPNTKRYKKLQQQIKSWKEYVAKNPLPPPREA